MFSSLKGRFVAAREQGFTLTELVVAILIAGILAAIALPVLLNAQKSVSSLDVKTGLVQAANLIEAEKGDNNQLYPIYMPNELLQNDLWKNFHYAYHSPDRLSYCLAGDDSSGKQWYVSNSVRTPSNTNCYSAASNDGTGNGGTGGTGTGTSGGTWVIGKGSTPPWTITFPKVDVSTYSLNWASGASNPTGSVTWGTSACNVGDTSYQLHIVNTTQGIDVKVPTDAQITANHGGLSTSSYAPDLTGWLPGDQTTVSVAPVCTESLGGTLYTYIGPYSGASQSATVPQFPLPNSSFSTAPAAYYVANADNTLTMKTSATFSTLTCPVLSSGISGSNTPVYELIAQQAGQTDVGTGTFSTNPAVTLTLTSFKPDTQITYVGRSYCQFTRTSGSVSRYSGTNVANASTDGRVVTNEFSPVGFPSAPSKPTAVSTNNGTVKPDGLTWSAPTTRLCTYGGTLQYSYVQSSPGSSSSAYSASTASGLINFQQATNYTYYVNAKCVGTNRSSDVTAGPSLTFTTSVVLPAASWQTQYTSSYSSGQLLANGSLNSISCPNNSAVRYFVKASQSGKSDVTYDGTSNSPTLYLNTSTNPANGFNGDQLVTYTGYGYCRVTQFDNSTKDWQAAAATSTQYAAVANPASTATPGTYVTGDPDYSPNGLSWSGQSCPNGGSIRYQYVQVSPGSSTSGWITSASVANLGWNPGTTYQYKINFQCVGSNRSSDVLTGGTNQFYVNWNTPHTPSAPSSVWTDQYGSSGITTPNRVLWYSVSCDRAATPQYYVRQVRVGGNYISPESGGYQSSGWMTGTVYNVPDSWLRQGSQIGYQVTAQCVGPGGTSDYNHGWSGERVDTTGISQPSAVNLSLTGDRSTVWNTVGCGQGAYTQYLWQQYNHNQGQTAYGSPFDDGWGNYTSATVDGYNGYGQGVRVYTRCVGDNAVSSNAESNHIDYTIAVYSPKLYLTCKPGSTTDYSGYGNGNCDNITVGFGVQCGSGGHNPNWNGTSNNGNGIYINSATGLKSTQLDHNNGDRFARHSGGTSSSGGGWGSWDLNISGTSCTAGSGVTSGTTTWNHVLSSTGGGTTYN